MPHILDDAPRGARQLAASGAVAAEGVGQLCVRQQERVGAPGLVGLVLAHASCELAGLLRLHRGHHLQLGAAATTDWAEDGKALHHTLVAVRVLLVGVQEEHEHTPLLLHLSERLAAVPSDVADARGGHLNDSAISACFVVHVHRAGELLEKPVKILPCPHPLAFVARHVYYVADVLHDTAGGPSQLLASHATLAQGVGQLVILQPAQVCTPILI
mmetsp:Transcript_33727/g.73654  ORF Transcript_33727/g.73654 Transcript_33727/m.73654 type:complete len:215 (+) Transcript_33727:956-1600(+)